MRKTEELKKAEILRVQSIFKPIQKHKSHHEEDKRSFILDPNMNDL